VPNKIDFKKELKELYAPSAKEISVVKVPKLNFLSLDGKGDPNTSQEYKEAVETGVLPQISDDVQQVKSKSGQPQIPDDAHQKEEKTMDKKRSYRKIEKRQFFRVYS